MLSRLGPAPAPLVCAFFVVVIVAVGFFVPIGRPSRTLDGGTAFAMALGAITLGIWGVALAVQSNWLHGVESRGVILTPAMSPGVGDVLFSLPFLVVVPVAAAGVFSAIRGGPLTATAVSCALVWAALCGLRETDGTGYVRDGVVTQRKGWLWVRRVSVPAAEVGDVVVGEEVFRGAPNYVVKFEARAPALVAMEARFRVKAEAEAEAERWRRAVGPLRGAP